MKFFIASVAALAGLASATEPDRNCGKITQCHLVNLAENGERNVFNAKGIELTGETSFNPQESDRGWSIKCETAGEIHYVKYFFEDGSVNTHYSTPFFINGDNSGTYINKLDSLSNQCGDLTIKVTAHTWTGGDPYPCDTETITLVGPPKAPAFRRCHLCRRCKSLRFHTTGVFPMPFPAVPELAVINRKGETVLTHEFDNIRYRPGRDYVDAYWLDYPKYVKEVADNAVYMRAKNSCGVATWRKCSVGSPIALDLDMSGAVEHIYGEFDFDLSGNGIPEELTEWFAPTEGILVDSTYPGFESGELIGWHLYGDLGGLYDDGFDKLALHDFNNDGVVSGDELEGIAVWTDVNSNAVLDDGELSTLDNYNVTSLTLAHDENYISNATLADGSFMVTQDKWFAR